MLPVLILLSASAVSAGNVSNQAMYLEQIRQYLPPSPPWEQWVQSSRELPPDFDTLPSQADLPNPLLTEEDGKTVRIVTPEAWEIRRKEILEQFQHWLLGTVPPAPNNLEAKVIEERNESGTTIRKVELRFGPSHQAKLGLELIIPAGIGPFPVFMTQDNHRQWALIALRRGYLVCVYAGADSNDDTDSFIPAYPEQDWSRLTRRAWAASRCIDYLSTVPQARMDQIAVTGHSRNGKLSLIASALDPRISVVISSSSGVGGTMPSRYCGESEFAEGIENITRSFPEWFHPRWRFFVGREQKMPVDWNELVALSAPRSCLLSIALNDGVESTWAMEQTYRSVKPLYQLYGAEDRFRILWRPDGHETWTATIERYVDWCDAQFGRGTYAFTERLIHPWDWESWSKTPGHALNPDDYPERLFEEPREETTSQEKWDARRGAMREAVQQILGNMAGAAHSPIGTYGEEPDHIEELLDRMEPGAGLEKNDLMFGDYINADIFAPKGTKTEGKPIPAILWLHPVSLPRGYVAAYRRGEQAFRTFARAGYAVFCYDQIGFGRRIEEVEGFYSRYPDASLLGQMVKDAQAALDALTELPYVAQDKVYVAGYGLGAMVALHLAALDDRPTGYALVCPPPPFRLDANIAETGGITRWSHRHMFVPRLGFFVSHETHVPYDIDELLGAMAPRPVLVVHPRYDRHAPLKAAESAVDTAKTIYRLYGAEEALTQKTPETYNHFDPSMQQVVVDWLMRIKEGK